MFRPTISRFAFLFLFSTSLFAQRDLATLGGLVTDPAGAVVTGARVTITEEATGVSNTLRTENNGSYLRPALKPGSYTVTVEATGFKKAFQKGVLLTAGDRVDANLTLQVGDVTQSVEVQASAPLLQTESTTIGADINTRSVGSLPLGGQRKAAFLVLLTPGVVPGQSGGAPGDRDTNSGGFSANGVRDNGQNNYLLNGVDNNVNVIDFLNGASYVIGPPPDAISEMRIMTNGYNAEYGRGAGGVVDVTIKSGTNSMHGSAWEYLQNTDLNANRWEANLTGQPRGQNKQNQFGATAGGPILKNRTFWFTDYQGTIIRATGGQVPGLGTSAIDTVPTAAMKNGDFSQELGAAQGTDALGHAVRGGQIYDILSTRANPGGSGEVRDPFPGNLIPLSRMDPAAMKIVGLYPNPNQNLGAAIPASNYYVVTNGAQQNQQFDIRIDHKISDRDNLFGSVSWADEFKNNSPVLPSYLDSSRVYISNLNRNALLSYTRVWTPSIITESRVAFSRLVAYAQSNNYNVDVYKTFGIGGFDPYEANGQLSNGGLPNLTLQNYTTVGGPTYSPTIEFSNVWDFIQNVAVNRGSHSLKFGAEFRPIQFPFFQTQYLSGNLVFNKDRTNNPQPAFQGSSGDAIASLLLGYPDTGNMTTHNEISDVKSAYAFFAQDDWKVSRKLTINLGIRYELFSPIKEKFGRQSDLNFDTLTLEIPSGPSQDAPLPSNFATSYPQLKVSRGVVSKYLIPWDKLNFAPRIGFAWQALSKTVIRAGFGMFYGGEENQGGGPNRGAAIPFNTTISLVGPTYDPNPYFSTLANGFPLNVYQLPAPPGFKGITNNFRTPVVQKWNLAVQRELGHNTALEVAYVGNHQAHQLYQWDPNTAPSAPNVLVSSTTQNALRPYPNIGATNFFQTNGFGNYNALTAKLEKRLSSGLDFTATYAWGHSLSDTQTPLTNTPDGLGTPNPLNSALQYSNSPWDIRQNFTSGFVGNLPFGKGRHYGANWNRAAQSVLGSWQVNGIVSVRTGGYFGLNTTAGVGYIGKIRPNELAGTSANAAPPGGRRPGEWFDIANIVAPAPYTNGNLGNQTNVGPGTHNVDLSLFKDFPLRERFHVEFRAESFNLFNSPRFDISSIGLTQGNSDFGQLHATLAGSNRVFQFALKLAF